VTPKQRPHRRRRALQLLVIVLVVAAGAFDAQAAALDQMPTTQEATTTSNGAPTAGQLRLLTDQQLVTDLSDCLSGAYQMLHQVSVGDTAGALSTSERFARPCAAVGVAVGP
jgi:hypothetical protein